MAMLRPVSTSSPRANRCTAGRGSIERASECTLLIKSTEAVYPLLERLILEHHPYELPEILALPAVRGLDRYLTWIAAGTA